MERGAATGIIGFCYGDKLRIMKGVYASVDAQLFLVGERQRRSGCVSRRVFTGIQDRALGHDHKLGQH